MPYLCCLQRCDFDSNGVNFFVVSLAFVCPFQDPMTPGWASSAPSWGSMAPGWYSLTHVWASTSPGWASSRAPVYTSKVTFLLQEFFGYFLLHCLNLRSLKVIKSLNRMKLGGRVVKPLVCEGSKSQGAPPPPPFQRQYSQKRQKSENISILLLDLFFVFCAAIFIKTI